MKGKGILACLLGLWLIAGNMYAQQYERRWAIGAGVNMMDYAAPQGAKLFQPNNWDLGYYMSLQRYLSAAFRLSADFTYAYGVRFPASAAGTRPALADMSYRLAFKFNNGTILGEKAFIAPYASFGIGGSYVESSPDVYVPLGGGLNIRAGQRSSLRLEMTYKRSLNQDFQHIAHTAYFVYDLGKQKKFAPKPMPETAKPSGPWIALEAPDADADGVPDHYDRCPADPGSWDWQGCPGVPAGAPLENITKEAGPLTTNPAVTPSDEEPFFPDLGAENSEARPRVKANTEVSSTPAAVNNTASFTDPMSTPNHVSNSSESEILKEKIVSNNTGSFLDPVATNEEVEKKEDGPNPCQELNTDDFGSDPIFFDLGTHDLSASAKSDLDEVARMLQRCSSIRLEVLGHADALGTERNNQMLSVLRANAVKRYLVYQHGISLSRIRCQGFGEQSPSANNVTSEGRKRNRRVDFRWQ